MLARWLVTSLLIVLACASAQAPPPGTLEKPGVPPATGGTPPATADAAAPPASGAAADELREAPPPPPDPPPAAGQVDQGEGWTTPDLGRATPGYRIQIFASTEEVRAKEVAGEARSRFGYDGAWVAETTVQAR
jgi:hypothetical protein